jgi:hypothetical protein
MLPGRLPGFFRKHPDLADRLHKKEHASYLNTKCGDIEPSDPMRKQSDEASAQSTTLKRFSAAHGSRSVERFSGRT